MDDTTQSTDVGGEATTSTPTATAEESTSAAASTVSQSTEDISQTAPAGDVTTQSVIEATETDTGTVDPAQDDDPLKDVPSLEELEQNKTQQYAQALINLRTAYEARKAKDSEVQATLTGVQPLIEKYGGADTLQARLEAYDSLFTPVVDPETQQPEFHANGLPKVSASKFIEQVDGENPGLAEQMLNDLLQYSPDNGGQKLPLWTRLFEAWGLDPKRLDDYKNIDALAVSTGEVTPEELEAIPENQREAYKMLPKSLRDAWKDVPEDEKKYHLDGAQERLEARRYRDAEAKRQAETQQQQLAAAQQQITQAQEAYVSEQLREGYATIMDEVARQVTFSADPIENSKMLGITGAFIFALRDPEYAQVADSTLNAFGMKLDQSFYEALSVADKHMRDFKTYELVGQKGFAQNSQTKANAAKTQVFAKLAPLALKVAKALGGQAAQRASQQNQLLGQATAIRPTPGGGTQAEGNGSLIPGILPNDPRYGIELARRTGLLRQ